MPAQRPVTILCLASFLKGHDFLRECRRLGCRVRLRHASDDLVELVAFMGLDDVLTER